MKEAMQKWKDNLYNEYEGDTYSKYVKDVVVSWWAILLSFVLAFVLGFVYMLIIFCCAKILVWIIIVSLFVCFLALFFFMFFYANHYDKEDNNYKYLRYGSFGVIGVAIIYGIVIVCCFN